MIVMIMVNPPLDIHDLPACFMESSSPWRALTNNDNNNNNSKHNRNNATTNDNIINLNIKIVKLIFI